MQGRDCYLCWLYHNEPAYRETLDRPPEQLQPPAPAPAGAVFAFLDAMATEAAWRAKGHSGPSAEEKAARRAKCDPCEKRDKDKDLCTACSCYLSARVLPPIPLGKIDCSTQKCPLDLWDYAEGYSPPAHSCC
jgi:hypothetical protein